MKMSSEETSEESDTDSDLSVNVNPTSPGETDNVLETTENGLELPQRRPRQDGPVAAIIEGSNLSNDADDFQQQPLKRRKTEKEQAPVEEESDKLNISSEDVSQNCNRICVKYILYVCSNLIFTTALICIIFPFY